MFTGGVCPIASNSTLDLQVDVHVLFKPGHYDLLYPGKSSNRSGVLCSYPRLDHLIWDSFSRERLRRVFRKKTSVELRLIYIFASSHLHLHIYISAHLHIFTSAHLHLHIFTVVFLSVSFSMSQRSAKKFAGLLTWGGRKKLSVCLSAPPSH